MELRLEQQPRQRGRQTHRGQQTMQARQTQIEKVIEQQQQTAIILERVMGRLDTVERWQEGEERAKERQEERRDTREERAPDDKRANLALLVSAASSVFYLIGYIMAHWKP